ncbi:hypothetical protein UlMin_001330 [Ulmus minor]
MDPTQTAPAILRPLVTLDARLSQNLHRRSQPFLPHFLLLLLELSADFRLFFPISLSLLLAPPPFPSPQLRPFLVPLLLGLLLDLALAGLLKILVRRSRPHYNKNMSIAVSVDLFSFPSGHSSRVCFVATLVYLSASAFADALVWIRFSSGFVDRWIGVSDAKIVNFMLLGVWSWAIATSVSRILLGRHFVFDVFAGACLGVLEGLVAFHFLGIEKIAVR